MYERTGCGGASSGDWIHRAGSRPGRHNTPVPLAWEGKQKGRMAWHACPATTFPRVIAKLAQVDQMFWLPDRPTYRAFPSCWKVAIAVFVPGYSSATATDLHRLPCILVGPSVNTDSRRSIGKRESGCQKELTARARSVKVVGMSDRSEQTPQTIEPHHRRFHLCPAIVFRRRLSLRFF